jgi:protein TIF31
MASSFHYSLLSACFDIKNLNDTYFHLFQQGFRVTVQSIIPGILDKDQEQSVVHGSTDFGKTCATNPKYDQLLEKVCTHLKMRPHKIQVENNQEIMLYSSIECKGIVGNDSRHYVLDLLRMFPPDLNYLPGRK